MSASLVRNFAFGLRARQVLGLRSGAVCQTWSRTAFFRRQKDKDEEAMEDEVLPPAVTPGIAASNTLRKRVGLQTVRGYSPPADVAVRMEEVVREVCGDLADWTKVKLDNNIIKFKVLDRAMSEFDHYVPNSQLSEITTISDVLEFFSTPVRDSSSYEDLSKLNLPPNLHIQLEALRFDPETDTMFDGVSAFPERETIVSSLKYRRKYGKSDQ